MTETHGPDTLLASLWSIFLSVDEINDDDGNDNKYRLFTLTSQSLNRVFVNDAMTGF